MIAVDIDGVLANWVKHALVSHPNADTSQYSLGLQLHEFKLLIDRMIDGLAYQRLEPYPDVVETLLSWGDVVYVTRRRPGYSNIHREHSICAQTYHWLVNHGFPHPKSVVYTQNKAEWCEKARPKLMVEDYLKDAQEILGVVPCYLVNRPWNKGGYPSKMRINTLADIRLSKDGGHLP